MSLHGENAISTTKNVLLDLSSEDDVNEKLDFLRSNFCGIVARDLALIDLENILNIYAVGDVSKLPKSDHSIQIIEDLSYNLEDRPSINTMQIDSGKVPILLHGVGIYYRKLFDEEDLFSTIESEHTFQELTESNKASKAMRKGIYLSDIRQGWGEKEDEILHFHLLRCSSNLSGPTDNFRCTDWYIVKAVNKAIDSTLEIPTQVNHVLAQIYENKKKENNKEVKAKIKAHSDKTKDMEAEGVIAFCTFYDSSEFEHLMPSKTDEFDWCNKEKSGLTRLLFKLKPTVEDSSLVKEFSVTLYPNSVFIIPLSTNRLYTHETRPSMLNIDRIPTRMGYVARCSKLKAQFRNNKTYILESDTLIPLQDMTEDSMQELRHTYYEENKSEKHVQYGKVHFSMNAGDYQKPIL